MAIQGTQILIYTYTHFCIFYFSIFFLLWKENKEKTENQPNKNIKKHTKHKTRLAHKLESKTNK